MFPLFDGLWMSTLWGLIQDSYSNIMPNFFTYGFESYLNLSVTVISGYKCYRSNHRGSMSNWVRDMGDDIFGIRA